MPSIAAIAPTPTGTADCIYLPRLRTVRTASAKGESAGSNVSGVFPERVSRNEAGRYPFLFQHAIGSYGSGQDGGLCLLSKLELIFRAFETELGDLVAERFVGFIKSLFRNRMIGGEFFAHANGLGALSGEEECEVCHCYYFNTNLAI